MTRSSSASGGELCSALGSAAGKNLAAVGGRHSLAEAMLLFSLQLFGLIGSGHFFPSLHAPHSGIVIAEFFMKAA